MRVRSWKGGCTCAVKRPRARLGRCGAGGAPANREHPVSRRLLKLLPLLVLLLVLPRCLGGVAQPAALDTVAHHGGPIPPPRAVPPEAEPEVWGNWTDGGQPHVIEYTNVRAMWAAAQGSRFPAIASIRLPYEGHTCLGTLIHPAYVLSAAHCLHTVGVNAVVEFPGGQIVRAKRSIIHPKWKGDEVHPEHDLALLHLQEPMHVAYPTLAAPGTPFTRNDVYPSKLVLGFRLQDKALLECAHFTVVKGRLCPGLAMSDEALCIYSQDAQWEAGASGGPVLIPGSPLVSAGPTKGSAPTLDLLVGVVSSGNLSAGNSGVAAALVADSRCWIDSVIKADTTWKRLWELAPIFVFLGIAVGMAAERARLHVLALMRQYCRMPAVAHYQHVHGNP